MRYTTLADVKQRLGITDAVDDASLQAAIDAAEDAVDAFCGRRFDLTATPTARRFTADGPDRLRIDDATEVTAVAVDANRDGIFEATLQASEYELLPYDAAARGRPYERILLLPAASQRFPLHPGGVQVTAKWGWPLVPAAVKAATEHEAGITFRVLTQAPFGADDTALTGGSVAIRSRFLDGRSQALLRGLVRVEL